MSYHFHVKNECPALVTLTYGLPTRKPIKMERYIHSKKETQVSYPGSSLAGLGPQSCVSNKVVLVNQCVSGFVPMCSP